MIGMTGKNGHGPVNLLGGHDSRHLMRPSHCPKAERERSRSQKSWIQAVRAADNESSVGNPLVPRAAKLCGKAQARHLLAGLVKRDHRCAWWNPDGDGLRLFPLAIVWTRRTALSGLAQFDAGKTDRAASGGGSFEIARGQLPLGSGFRPPNANEQETHRVSNRRV